MKVMTPADFFEFPTSPKDLTDRMDALQDIACEAAAGYITVQNSVLESYFGLMPDALLDADMGNKLPAAKVPVSMKPAVDIFHQQFRRFLP